MNKQKKRIFLDFCQSLDLNLLLTKPSQIHLKFCFMYDLATPYLLLENRYFPVPKNSNRYPNEAFQISLFPQQIFYTIYEFNSFKH
jgi:hypothetical protein